MRRARAAPIDPVPVLQKLRRLIRPNRGRARAQTMYRARYLLLVVEGASDTRDGLMMAVSDNKHGIS